ncbi:MAG: hypothetical protein Q7T01_00510 [bacterium]|nr:hypothetical protein [bacterium]
MTTQEKYQPPLMMRGDRLLLALDALYGMYTPVAGIDTKRTHRVFNRLIGFKPKDTIPGIAYAHRQLDATGKLREILRSASAEELCVIQFDARVLLRDVRAGRTRTIEHLERFFAAIAAGELTEADFRGR